MVNFTSVLGIAARPGGLTRLPGQRLPRSTLEITPIAIKIARWLKPAKLLAYAHDDESYVSQGGC